MLQPVPVPRPAPVPPAVAARLDPAGTGAPAVVTVVAAAGRGKTAALAGCAADRPTRWFTASPARPAGPTGRSEVAMCLDAAAAVDRRHPGRPGLVVLDDLDSADPAALAELLDLLIPGLPPGLSLVLVSRRPLPRTRALVRVGAATVGPAELALPVEMTARLLAAGLGRTDHELAADLAEVTGGWPALVDRAVAGLSAARADGSGLPLLRAGGIAVDSATRLAESLAAVGTALHAYVLDHVLGSVPAAARRLLRDAAHLPAVDAELGRALGHRGAGPSVAELAAVGLLVPAQPAAVGLRVHPLVAAALRAGGRAAPADRRRVLAIGLDRYRTDGHHRAALDAARQLGAAEECRRLLAGHGSALVAGGGAAAVVAAVTALPAGSSPVEVDRVLVEALQVQGEWEQALAVCARLDRGGPLDAALAWRAGSTHYLRGDPRSALSVLVRGVPDDAPDPADGPLLHAWTAAAHWATGDTLACGAAAASALRAATELGAPGPLAAAHVAMALHARLVGDRVANAWHYVRGLSAATAADDQVQLARIHCNRGAALLEEARYTDALAETRSAVRCAGRAGHVATLVVSLHNQGETLSRLGRLDEAVRSYEQALSLCQRTGSRSAAHPLTGLGDVHRRRGRLSLARGAYEEAVRLCEAEHLVEALVPALAGLARVLREQDPAAARQHADRALHSPDATPYPVAALLASGWVHLAEDAHAAAATEARHAAEVAGRHRDRAGLAESLELRAAAGGADAAAARRFLGEAVAIWTEAGALLDAARARLALARLAGSSAAARAQGRAAAAELSLAGVLPSGPALPGSPGHSPVAVRVLGRFAVQVDGRPLPGTAWQSRKARELLLFLVARRARAVTREELAHVLWGDDDPDRVGHRLSVALSTIRSVLDPQRRRPQDWALLTDGGSVALNRTHVWIDVDAFLADARYGFALRDEGVLDQARITLTMAAEAYSGDFGEEEPYEGWAVPLREEARAVALRVYRCLFDLARQAEDTDGAVRALLGLLDRDPYDEQAHRALVQTLTRAGRHGEARRAQRRLDGALRELGLLPSSA